MSKLNNPEALHATRWIDQRLREIVMHFQPMAKAVSDGHRETAAPAKTDPRQFQRERELLAVKIRGMRGRAIHEADDLLALRRQLAARCRMFPQEPLEIIGELAEMRRTHEAQMEKLAEEWDWFERAYEYHVECSRCDHDGDVRPSPVAYGLENSERNEADDGGEGE